MAVIVISQATHRIDARDNDKCKMIQTQMNPTHNPLVLRPYDPHEKRSAQDVKELPMEQNNRFSIRPSKYQFARDVDRQDRDSELHQSIHNVSSGLPFMIVQALRAIVYKYP